MMTMVSDMLALCVCERRRYKLLAAPEKGGNDCPGTYGQETEHFVYEFDVHQVFYEGGGCQLSQSSVRCRRDDQC
jgi:hypothetical protein